MPEIYQFLEEQNITYEKFEHPPVFTCEEAEKLCPEMPGVSIKNLFLRDKKGKRHFLIVLDSKKTIDLKKLSEILTVSGLGFASPDRLKTYLGVEPGSVTLLALINDINHQVEVIIDQTIWGKTLQCHPLINTASLAIPHEGIEKFLKATGHPYKILELPS